jgi:glutamate/tyrosine decarboxylase-like PLP-dependent enzyme
MFFTRDSSILPTAFHAANDYMPSHHAGRDPYLNSVQWSRRFLGLRLFLSLAAAGWEGYARHVEHAVEMAALLKAELRARGWTIANDSQAAVVCADPPPGSRDIPTIVQRVLASGKAWVSAATFETRPVVRACVTHGETAQEDVATLVEALEAARC